MVLHQLNARNAEYFMIKHFRATIINTHSMTILPPQYNNSSSVLSIFRSHTVCDIVSCVTTAENMNIYMHYDKFINMEKE